MATSVMKKVFGMMAECEQNSDRRIDPNFYYIVRISLFEPKGDATAVDIAKSIITQTDTILVTYVSITDPGEIYFLFSSVDTTKPHFLNGSHHALCSKYAAEIALEHSLAVKVSIVEFDSKPTIVSYFHSKVYEHFQRYVSVVAPGKSLDGMSIAEMEILVAKKLDRSKEKKKSKKGNVDDNTEATPKEKFGVFYKKVLGSNNKPKFVTLSEPIDMRDLAKYDQFFFG